METNLLNWYSFKKDSSIKIIENEENENASNQYDYVIIYSPSHIVLAKQYVKIDGTILLVTDNRMGVTYLAGGARNGRIYDTIINGKGELFSREEIIEEIQKNGFQYYKFYYPLPNYKQPNVIYSDEYLPKSEDSKLLYNICYEDRSAVVFDELKALKQFTKNNLFTTFANSFLVEINNTNVMDKAKFISFNNNRKEEYQLKTIIYPDIVEKRKISEASQKHIDTIKANIQDLKQKNINVIDDVRDDIVYSKYIEGNTLDKDISGFFAENQKEKAFELIEKWYENIKQTANDNKSLDLNENINVENIDLDKLTIIKDAYIDLVFENTFYRENSFVFFDQEWKLQNIPLEFILYRAINNMYTYNRELEKYIDKDEIFKRFNLDNYLTLFCIIEKYFQDEVLDENKINNNHEQLKALVDINMAAIIFKENETLKEENKRQQQYINTLEQKFRNRVIRKLKKILNKGEK